MRRLSALVAVVAAVSPAAPLAAAAPAGGSWPTHRTAGLSISAPPTWLDMTRLTPQVLERARQVPALAAYVDLLRQSSAIKLFLADAGPLTVSHSFATNCNILQLPTIGDLRLQRDGALAQLRSGIAVGAVHSRYVTLPAGRAVELRYHGHFGTGARVLSYLQLMFVRGGRSTVITYTTVPELEGQELPLFRRSARTFRFR